MIVRYEVEYWNDMTHKSETECGIIGIGNKETIGTAVDEICNYYGKENVFSIKVYECENILVDEDIRDLLSN